MAPHPPDRQTVALRSVAVAGPDLMTRVDALEAEGRLLEAVDALGASDALDDVDQAARLLRLRHGAFAQLDRDAAPASWPPVLPDPFPGLVGLPELERDELTPALVGGSILHHGAAVVRGLVPSDDAKRISNEIEQSFAAIDAWIDAGRPDDPMSPWFVPFETAAGRKEAMRTWVRSGGGVWGVESPVVTRRILDLYRSIGLREVLAGYFGEAPAVSFEKLTLRKVGPDTIPSWHQDGAFLGDGTRSVNVWVTLSDCGGDADVPGLELVPRRISELLETGTCGSVFPNSIGHELVTRIAEPEGIVRPVFRAGDALLFDERFVHRSAVSDGMTGHRYAVESWFFPASNFPDGYDGLAF